MKRFKTWLSLVLGVLLLLALSACSPESNKPPVGGGETKSVSEISIKKMPDKVEYFLNEEFSVEGGVILVKYSDDSTGDVAMTDSSVEVTAPNTSRVGEKTVTVKYDNKKATFKISVSEKGFDVKFDYNYTGSESLVKNVTEGSAVEKPSDPSRTGYTFYNWYADKNCTVEYDFDSKVTAPTTIYAQWKENSATYYDVTYNLNYYGCAKSEYKQIVKASEKVMSLALTPARTDYKFVGWSKDEAGAVDYNLNESITADTVIYAKWEKTKQGYSTYVFEAENVDLSQKAGPGYSGENAGRGMIVTNPTVSASGNKFVAYQCKNGNSLEFYIACDEEVEDAQLVVRFAAEFSSMTLTPDIYSISVNDQKLSYSNIVLNLSDGEQQGQFNDFTISNISLKKGANVIQLKTTNSMPLGGTLTATAPIIDCIKITTSAVLIWDGNYGLPANVG